MPTPTPTLDLHALARVGARLELQRILDERERILRSFPELQRTLVRSRRLASRAAQHRALDDVAARHNARAAQLAAAPSPDGGPLLTTHDAAAQLGLVAPYLSQLARQRRIAHVRVGRLIRFTQAAIDAFKAERDPVGAQRRGIEPSPVGEHTHTCEHCARGFTPDPRHRSRARVCTRVACKRWLKTHTNNAWRATRNGAAS